MPSSGRLREAPVIIVVLLGDVFLQPNPIVRCSGFRFNNHHIR